jgi:hypothetical protein
LNTAKRAREYELSNHLEAASMRLGELAAGEDVGWLIPERRSKTVSRAELYAAICAIENAAQLADALGEGYLAGKLASCRSAMIETADSLFPDAPRSEQALS